MAEDKRRAARPPSPQAPPGYRKVPDSEKQATLEVLRLRKREVETAQRTLPFKIETAGQKKREKDLEDRLAHLDKLVGMFTQPVVFIPADAEPIATSVPPLPQGLAGRPTKEREDGPLASEASREPRGRSGGETHEGRAGTPTAGQAAIRLSSREGRDKANADRRAQACDTAAPWDKGAPPCRNTNIRTGVQVLEPPGGKSSFSLNWA